MTNQFTKWVRDNWNDLRLLLYWPFYMLTFLAFELATNRNFHVMHCSLDDVIPFCEWFFIPYLAWFPYMIGMGIYSFFADREVYRRYMWYIIVSYSIGLLVFALYPTVQQLRPVSFAENNALTSFIRAFYAFDSNTNVCPSLHVVGSVAVMHAGLRCRKLQHPLWKAFFLIMTGLISVSTVFMKQHSALDIPPSILVCVIAYLFAYRTKVPSAAFSPLQR